MISLPWKILVAAFALLLFSACRGGDGLEDDPSPSSSQPSGKIAFVSFRDDDGVREIYVMDADGSGVTNLTNNPAADLDPDWSPDGTQIVFASDRDDNPHLFVMDADGSNVRQLTFGAGFETSPRWSPDGARIAFSGSGNIVVMDADGGNRVTVLQTEADGGPCRTGSFPGGWSPDSSHVTYYSSSSLQDVTQVCSIAADGSDLQVLVNEPPGSHTEPVWSPDGRFIAFRSVRDSNHDIYVIDLESGEERRLTDHLATDIEPDWSPDGEWIVFGSSRDNPFFDIFIMRKDGSDVRQLTTDPAKDANPVWAP